MSADTHVNNAIAALRRAQARNPGDASIREAIAHMARAKDAAGVERPGAGGGAFPQALFTMPRPTRIHRPPGVTVALAAGVVSAQLPIQWPCAAIVIGVAFGCLENTAASLGALGARIVTDGNSELFSDGYGGTFAHVAGLQCSLGVSNVAFWPMYKRVLNQGMIWQVMLRNETGGATVVTPTVQFMYIDPADLDD